MRWKSLGVVGYRIGLDFFDCLARNAPGPSCSMPTRTMGLSEHGEKLLRWPVTDVVGEPIGEPDRDAS
jgi:hypothetical protein